MFVDFGTRCVLSLADMQGRGLIALLTAGIAWLLARRASAAARHLILLCAVLSLLCLPVLSLVLPPIRMPPLRAAAPDGISQASDAGRSLVRQVAPAPTRSTQATEPAPATRPAAPAAPAAPRENLPLAPFVAAALFGLWGGGAVARLVCLACGMVSLGQTARTARKASEVAPLAAETAGACAACLGLKSPVETLLGGAQGQSPMTWGFVHPVVWLPAEAAAWPMERLRPVLLHELAHVQRHDWLWVLLAQITLALYWPNPLMWVLVRRLQAEAERACDDKALLTGIAPADYAQQLVEIVRDCKASRGSRFTPAALTMVNRPEIELRVKAILSSVTSRQPVSGRRALLVAMVVLCFVVPLAGLRGASAGGQDTQPPPDSKPITLENGTYYNSALPVARQLARLQDAKTLLEKAQAARAAADLRFAPGSTRFASGIIAHGLYVAGVAKNGQALSWDSQGNLLFQGSNWPHSNHKISKLTFEIDYLELPGFPNGVDKATYRRLQQPPQEKTVETEFGVVGYSSTSSQTVEWRGAGYGVDRNDPSQSVTIPTGTTEKVDLYLTVGYGPWQNFGEASARKGATVSAPGGGMVTLTPLNITRGGEEIKLVANLPARLVRKDANGRPQWRLRLELLDAAGKAVGRPRVVQQNELPGGNFLLLGGKPVANVVFRFVNSDLPMPNGSLFA